MCALEIQAPKIILKGYETMKKLLLIAALMLALVVTAVACSEAPSDSAETTVAPETTLAPETTAEPETNAPETNTPETTVESETTVEPETTAAPETNASETSAPETNPPETNAPDGEPTEPVYGNPATMSVCADNIRTWVGDTMTDLCTQEAHRYLNDNNHTVVIDGLDAVSFRGWANPTGVTIDQFGYQIDDGELVFSADFWQDEPELNAALNSPAAKRFENIKIPVADLAAGTYEVTLLVKDTNGVIYEMINPWGDILLVKN